MRGRQLVKHWRRPQTHLYCMYWGRTTAEIKSLMVDGVKWTWGSMTRVQKKEVDVPERNVGKGNHPLSRSRCGGDVENRIIAV